ncbi:hypothetical protein MSAN_00084400 [Mycena sanguinolenta]|uniref:F-box domain-containing protein n=1 Tax=Mycena sanguinolenta TaxID=230812 RepID=A0A8H7DII7_9AGAR|nr:hypothetical protein MSAN_00084400 [Mycena sanguinolenta]
MAVPKKLWKRSCGGISRWFLYESVPSTFDVSKQPGSPNAPVQKLPVELLGEIFSWTLGEWGPMTDEPSALLLEPLTISHVCGHWRAVSLSMPMLWATIWIDRPRVSHISMVKLWVERSRTCPLSIYLRQTDPKSCLSFPTSTEHDLTDEIFAVLLPHLSRWQTVDLIFKTDTQRSLVSISGDEAVALEHAALQVDSWDSAGADSIQSALYSRPLVRSVCLYPSSSQHHVRWEQLTHVDAELECTPETWLSLLASSPALCSAKFACSAQPDWAATSFTHPEKYLTLPLIVELSIKASRIDLAPLFDRLTLPALRALALEYCHVPRTMPDQQSLHSLLDRSSCVLEFFSLHETARMRDAQRHITYLQIPLLASLKDLELKVDMTNEIVEFLTLDSQGSPPLPNLTAIVLNDSSRGDHISDVALLHMLSSRRSSTSNAALLCSAELKLRLTSHKTFALSVNECGRDNLNLRCELLNCFCECT